MPISRIGWVDKAKTTVEAVCDLRNDWHKYEFSYGFWRGADLEFLGDTKIRFRFRVFAKPRGFDKQTWCFPSDAVRECQTDGYGYSVKKSILTVKIQIQPGLNTPVPPPSAPSQMFDLTRLNDLSESDKVELLAKLQAEHERLKSRCLGKPSRTENQFKWIEPLVAINTFWFEMDVTASFLPPRGREPATCWDWYRRFCPGGLPSLGKKQ